ncbi:major facilitator superfamily protein [Actinidia rufa]|uniref:Major facilitator superfamily protein n=1 Tax=Actinidia rufa TaxID=165716 RepID=A0A7J0FZC4_9ERIC|nr:major facilitator superfamily protein [Actinidia rufa]
MMYFIRACTPASGEDSSVHIYFLFTQAESVALAIYLLTATILKDLLSLSNSISYIFVAIMTILLMYPIAIPIKMTLFPANPKKPEPPFDSSDDLVAEEGDSSQKDPLLVPSSSETYLGSFHNEDVSDVDMLLTGVSLGVDDTTILLSLFSFCNFLGRLGGGAVSEHFVSDSLTIMIITFLLYALAINGILYAATGLPGICYGVHFAIMIPTASELFGLRHFGIIFNFMQLGNPLGTLLFSGLLAGLCIRCRGSQATRLLLLGTKLF